MFSVNFVFQLILISSAFLLNIVIILFQIKENHRQEEKALNDFSDYVNRTSDYTVLRVGDCLRSPVIRLIISLLCLGSI